MSFSGTLHRAIIETLIEICDESLEEGPRRGFSASHESEHSNGGYLTIDTLIHCLQRVLTDEIPTSMHVRSRSLFCGGADDDDYISPFSRSFTSIDTVLKSNCQKFTRKLKV